MNVKSKPEKTQTSETAGNPFAKLQEAGFGSLAGMGSAWMETMSGMGAEVMNFMAERLKEDVKTQQEILQCKNLGELQHIQAKFAQKAITQYQEETGKLV